MYYYPSYLLNTFILHTADILTHLNFFNDKIQKVKRRLFSFGNYKKLIHSPLFLTPHSFTHFSALLNYFSTIYPSFFKLTYLLLNPQTSISQNLISLIRLLLIMLPYTSNHNYSIVKMLAMYSN